VRRQLAGMIDSDTLLKPRSGIGLELDFQRDLTAGHSARVDVLVYAILTASRLPAQ
jgi:hypothetical protein